MILKIHQKLQMKPIQIPKMKAQQTAMQRKILLTQRMIPRKQRLRLLRKKSPSCVGNETGSDRYVKVDDSKEVYTITEDSLTDILDSTASDFYSLSVNYLSVNNLDSLEIKTPDGDHKVTVTRETTKDSDDENAEETTTVTYKLDDADLDETTFTTFYNKLINMTAQQRLTEELYSGR